MLRDGPPSDGEGLDWCVSTGSCRSRRRTGQEDQSLSPGEKSQEANETLKVARGKRSQPMGSICWSAVCDGWGPAVAAGSGGRA